jgi:membrane fusion protein, copper/silver efflux system
MREEDTSKADSGLAPGRRRFWRGVAAVELLIIVAVALAVAAAAALQAKGPSAQVAAQAAQPAPAAKPLWICPMHPQIVRDHPGKCPICGMDLVEEKPQAAPTAGPAMPGLATVSLSEGVMQASGVRTAEARKVVLADEVRTVGRVEADETRVVRVHSRVSGWVTGIAANETGQRVRRGQTLLRVFSREVLQAESELAAGASDAARDRLLVLGMTQGEAGRPAAPGARGTSAIVSPATGFVVKKGVADGSWVEPGMDLFEIADLRTVWVWADVYERDLGRVSVGSRVEVRVEPHGDAIFEGKVTFLDPDVDESTRTLRARIEIPNGDLRLRPGMWTTVIVKGEAREVLAVPYDAVIDTGASTYVFVRTAPGEFTPRAVTVGIAQAGSVEVTSGLAQGDTVVVKAAFLVDSESRIRGAGGG